MERRSSMSDTGSAMNQLRAAIYELNSITADPGEFLATKLMSRAVSSHDTLRDADSDEEPSRGFALPRVSGDRSDAGLFEKTIKEENTTEEGSGSGLSKLETIKEELLGVAKSGPVFEWNDEKEKLLSQVLDQNSISVIPIVGMHGIGKTTLARLVFDDEKVQGHFELKAWVTVAGQEEDIARRLLKSAIGMICPSNSKALLDEMVSDALLSQRSLIVLDEVESINSESWMHMRESWFHVVGMGSKVIITTCNNEVATIVSEKSPFELGPLPNNASFSLFSSMACSPSVKGQAKRLAARCNGLPLSLKLLGSLIGFEQSLIHNFSSSDSGSPLDFKCVLSLSVLSLSEALFNCFAYCGIFPCGSVLEKEKLIRMWIADGVIKPSEAKPSMRMQSMEDTGEAYFRQLLCRSFFTDITCNEYGDVVQARMPRAIHEMAQRMAAAVYRKKVSLQRYNWRGADDETNYNKLKSLRSLDFSRSGIHSLPDFIVMLWKLTYLNLSHTLLTTLPDSFTNLTRLQTLDLSECYHLKALPENMSKLSELRHLDLSNCNSLQYMPSEIDKLSSLRTMPLYVLGGKHIKAAGLEQLRNLKEMQGVLHIRNLENVEKWSDANHADLRDKNLLHLVLSWEKRVDNDRAVLQFLDPNPDLKVLDIRGYGYNASPFPNWMVVLHKLVKLSIYDCGCAKLPTLGVLPLLKELQIKGMSIISSIDQNFYGNTGAKYFPSLQKLMLHDMQCLSKWSSGDYHSRPGAFQNLKILSIQDCPKLEMLPSFPSVKDLVVWKSHTKILQSLTTMNSLSSVVINDVDVKESFQSFDSLILVKKLIVIRSIDLDSSAFSNIMSKFTALEHLRILHCSELKNVELTSIGSLQKLGIVDCQNLKNFELSTENSVLTELVIEDCPQLNSIGEVASLASSIRKLIVRNCPLLSFSAAEIEMLKDLEFFCYVH